MENIYEKTYITMMNQKDINIQTEPYRNETSNHRCSITKNIIHMNYPNKYHPE